MDKQTHMLQTTTVRGLEWCKFAAVVLEHIEQYTVKQYKDAPFDNASSMTPDEMVSHIERYCKRHGNGARGHEEERRDLLKIAHYACMAYSKIAVKAPAYKLIYICSPYRCGNGRTIMHNVAIANEYALQISLLPNGNSLVPVVPHNYHYAACIDHDLQISEEIWMQKALQVLARCDAIYVPDLSSGKLTEGCLAELNYAIEHDIVIYDGICDNQLTVPSYTLITTATKQL